MVGNPENKLSHDPAQCVTAKEDACDFTTIKHLIHYPTCCNTRILYVLAINLTSTQNHCCREKKIIKTDVFNFENPIYYRNGMGTYVTMMLIN